MRTIGKKFVKEVQEAKAPTKKDIMALLDEKGIEYDQKAKVEDLLKLIPEE